MKNKLPLVSVVMSVYNHEKTVLKSIESILNQTYENIELLIIDDASEDNTYDLLKTVNDKRVRLFSNKNNLGLTKSLNLLLPKSKGEFIARQDSDDISCSNRIEKQYNYLFKNNIDACTSRAYIKNSKRPIPRFSYLFPPKLVARYKNPFIHGTLFIKYEVLKSLGFYNEKFKFAQDYMLFIDLMRKNYKIKIMKDKLYILNMHNNISTVFLEEQNYYANLARSSLN